MDTTTAAPTIPQKNSAKNHAMRPARVALTAALYAASIAVLLVAFCAPPSFAVFAAWRAAVAADADGMDKAARSLAASTVAAYRDAALYYAARSDALRPPQNGGTAGSPREAMRENLAASARDAAEPFSPNHFLHLDLPHQDMQLLLAYADFYARNYEQAMETYWDVLVNHPHNEAALRGYELSLFFYTYAKTQPARSYDEDARKNAAGLARSAPESLFKLEYGNTYYMLEKLGRNSQLPPY